MMSGVGIDNDGGTGSGAGGDMSLDRLVGLWNVAGRECKRAAIAALQGTEAREGPGRALRITDAAKAAGVSRGTLYNAMARGALRPVQLFEGGSPRILESELHRFLNGVRGGAR